MRAPSRDSSSSTRPSLEGSETPDMAFRRQVLVKSCTALAILLVLGTLSRHAIAPMPSWMLASNFVISLVFLATLILARQRLQPRYLAAPIIAGLTALLAVNTPYSGGVNAPIFPLVVILPVIGFCFGGRRLGRIALGIVVALIAWLLVADSLGWSRPLLTPESSSFQRAVNLFFISLGAYAVGAVYESARRRSAEKLVEASRMASLGTMAGGIAHEINNPLTVIAGYGQQLQWMAQSGQIDPAEASTLATRMIHMTQRMAKIVSGLQTYARDASDEPFLDTEIRSCIEDALALSAQRFKNSGIELLVSEVPAGTMITARPPQVAQVILNLLNNSFDAVVGTTAPWVRIDGAVQGDFVELRVTDSGAGIPTELRNKIFTPFFTTKEVGRGTGLGLSICAGIMSQHGGAIFVDEHSPSTTFVLRFRRAAGA